ncbi:YozE family protein [Dyadobacter chenhuakuii]|uniref:Sterile alpha motif-like domain-containing protein n=1 Tax=Dyadobacter chenhuakuii TaxID=2909339 RepID=A0ABY4XH88_9BACT|nr:YozE family protein [Dyadobacter chenhuakuii]MCF2495769.1 sterile alpha motif-like domain-containing protein [Dyadobacter chenhuakuii]USJ29800.1 sterile alpha motif-like domain-containing protein [Dyadobacter chenhuakuii]
MKQQKHTPAFVKRKAKNLKKESGISHMKALNTISIELGYHNWKHFLQSIGQQSIPNLEVTSEVYHLSFTDWLKKHKNRDSPLGDLASDMLTDNTWPLYEALDKYLDYMSFRNAPRVVVETVKRAWKSYKAYLHRKNSPKSSLPRIVKQKPKNHDLRKITYVSNVTPLHSSKRTVEKFAVGDKAWISWEGRKAIPVTIIEVDGRYYSFRVERPLKRAGKEHYLRLDEVRSTPELACINYVTW